MQSLQKKIQKKMHRGRLRGKVKPSVTKGDIGLQAVEPGYLTINQIESASRIFNKNTKRFGKFYKKIYVTKSVTARAEESRMGCGKGNIKDWVAVVKPGTVLFELAGLEKNMAINLLNKVTYKLPIKTKIIFCEQHHECK